MAKRAKRAIGVVIAIVILLAVAWFSLAIALSPLLRAKLQTQVSAHLNANLHIGSLRYAFPYGVQAWDVHLVGNADNVELFSCDHMELSLVRLPTSSGSLLINKIVLQKPVARIVRGANNSFSGTSVVRQIPGGQPTSKRISDILQLRILTINDGQVSYEDRSQPKLPPMVWENLNADMHLAPESGSQYGWDFAAASPQTATISVAGTIDVDQAIVDVTKLAIDAHVARDSSPSAMPSKIQNLMKTFGVEGAAIFQATAHIPLKELPASQVNASLQLNGVRADLNGSEFTCDLQLGIDKSPDNPQLSLAVKKLDATTEAGVISVQHLKADVDSRAGTWQLSDIALTLQAAHHTGVSGLTRVQGSISGAGSTIGQYDLSLTLDDLSLALRMLDRPLEHINGTLHAAAGQLTADRVSAAYGEDQFLVQSMRLPLDQLPDKIAFHDVAVTLDLHRPGPKYPGDLGTLLEAVNPAGSYEVHGDYTIGVQGPDESKLVLTSSGSDLRVSPQHVPITNVQADVLLTADQAIVRKFEANLFDGNLSATATASLHNPIQYQADIALRGVDVQQASQFFAPPDPSQNQNSGRADANLTLRGEGVDLNTITGHGDVRIADGQLWQFPIMQSVASKTKIAREALTAGEAAAMFDIANSQIQVSSAAINSPALGLQGNGTVGFDGKLDLSVIAAPLGDWQAHVKKTGIPFVSAVVGDIAGQLQKVVNSASELLYQFHVTGVVGQPVVEAEASTKLSDTKAAIFAEMMKKKQSLLDTLREFK
jgi:hypothetical protein